MRNLMGLSKRWPVQTLEQRFWSKVDKKSDQECWLWKGGLMPLGYGSFQVGVRRSITSHRQAWILTHGHIPLRLHVLHRCDVRRCVNPSHLWLGTHQENMADMVAKGRHRMAKP